MFGDHGLKRSLLPQRGGVFRPHAIKMVLACGFLTALERKQVSGLRDFGRESCNPLRDGFKFQRKLTALSAEGIRLGARCSHFRLQPVGFAIGRCHTFFGLRELIAQIRKRRHRLQNRNSRLLLLLLEFG